MRTIKVSAIFTLKKNTNVNIVFLYCVFLELLKKVPVKFFLPFGVIPIIICVGKPY